MKRPGKTIVPLRQQDAPMPERAPGDGATPPSETLGQAYIRQYDRLVAFFTRRTGNPDVARELTQDVWVRIAALADDRTIENPEAFLRRLVVNVSLNWLRDNKFHLRVVQTVDRLPDIDDEEPDAERRLQAAQCVAFMHQLLEQLPPRRRAAFLLYRGRGLTAKETAQELGVSVMTARTQIRDAIDYIRRRMIESGLWP
jgi:RNA polymerase sigma factor (sigma-70 family)